MTFARQVINFHRELKPNWALPEKINLLFPFDESETWRVFQTFYNSFFCDEHPRRFLFGINPGRFGAGVTGVPFTDPTILEDVCNIPNDFKKRRELSSAFVYEVVQAFGGPAPFYSRFYITSVCPLGFVKDGKNCNYYDYASLEEAVEPHIINNINKQMTFGCDTQVAYSVGQGKNFKYLKKLNDVHGFFDEIVPLPHPRWVMQYRLKRKDQYVDEYLVKLKL